MVPDRPTCPRCEGRDFWYAPRIDDETWWQRFDMVIAWRRDGTPIGSFEVCACESCGLVLFYADGVGELGSVEIAGVRRATGDACAACEATDQWQVGPMRDVRSSMNDSRKLWAHVRGLTYQIRAPKPVGDEEPIRLNENDANARPLPGKARARNMVSPGAWNGNPVGRLHAHICAGCTHTIFYAQDLEHARSAGRAIEHRCARCMHPEAIEIAPIDIRSEGISGKRVALARTDWGSTRAELLLRSCVACSHTEWYVDDTKHLARDAITGLSEISTGQRDELGAYRSSARTDDARASATKKTMRAPWLALASMSALFLAIALGAFAHLAWLLLAIPALAVAIFAVRQKEIADVRTESPRVRVAIADEPPEREEEEVEREPSKADRTRKRAR